MALTWNYITLNHYLLLLLLHIIRSHHCILWRLELLAACGRPSLVGWRRRHLLLRSWVLVRGLLLLLLLIREGQAFILFHHISLVPAILGCLLAGIRCAAGLLGHDLLWLRLLLLLELLLGSAGLLLLNPSVALMLVGLLVSSVLPVTFSVLLLILVLATSLLLGVRVGRLFSLVGSGPLLNVLVTAWGACF